MGNDGTDPRSPFKENITLDFNKNQQTYILKTISVSKDITVCNV